MTRVEDRDWSVQVVVQYVSVQTNRNWTVWAKGRDNLNRVKDRDSPI